MLLKMWKIVLIFVGCLVKSNAQEGDCILEGVTSNQWLTAYRNDPVDDFEETEFKTFQQENIIGYEIRGDYAKYFDARLEDDSLVIFPTDAFKRYEIEEESVASPEMNIQLAFTCSTGRPKTLSFYQPVRDSNTFNPEFTKTSYTYQLPMPLPPSFDISVFGEPIVACDNDITNTRLIFSISPDDDFSVALGTPVSGSKNKCHTAIISTKNYLRATTSRTYTITATDTGVPSKSTTTEFKIEVDEQISLPPNPQFDSPYYTADYNIDLEDDSHSIAVTGAINLKEGCSKLSSLNVIGDQQDYFGVECDGEQVVVKLKSDLSDEVLENNPIVVVTIEANLEQAEEPGRTVLVVYLPKQECPEATTVTPVLCPSTVTPTECPICPTESTTLYTCPLCTTEYPTTPTDCPPCSTTPADCPSVSTECPVSCPTAEPTTECPSCSTTPGDCPSVSTECPVSCPTAEPTTECPSCSTTPEPLPSESAIKFEQDNYWYKVKSWFVGVVGVVKAVAIPEEDIEYSIEGEGDFMECNPNTGELSITKKVDANTYTFTAYAVGATSKYKTQTIVQVEIFEDDVDSDPDTENSILVRRVTEEEESDITLPCRYTHCKYEIIPNYPESQNGIFSIQNNILHVNAVKREREDIIGLLVPQFTLHLVLQEVGAIQETTIHSNNNGSHMRLKRNVLADEIPSEWAYIPADIPNIPNQLLLSIIINDINNNRPIFEIGTELVVGYPTAELAVQLTPPYLAKVLATDLDAGENAKIRYSTESPHFTIHPETGVIYPHEDAFNDELNLEFIVTATDRNGDGLKTDLNIKVKPLTQENLIVLTVKNLMLEDIDATMQRLSDETNMKINYLTAAVIPLDNTEDSVFQADYTLRLSSRFMKSIRNPKAVSDHSSRIIVYGLDARNEPVKTDDLQEVLEDAGVLEDFRVDKWEPGSSGGGGENEEDPSTAGFIAAIAVLASLIVIFLAGAAAFYYFKIYRVRQVEPYDTMEEEDTNSVNFEKNPRASSVGKFEDEPKRRVTGFVFSPPPVEEDEDEFGERAYSEPIDTVEEWPKSKADEFSDNKIRLVDTGEDNIYSESKYESSSTDYDGDRAKSVTFKETVEKINIIVDDDDVLDERL